MIKIHTPRLFNNDKMKIFRSPNYNFIFDKKTGFFARWGKTINDDPLYAQHPEIADIEISTICHKKCGHCYKSNTECGKNMSFEIFKKILNKMDDRLTQVALGIGSIDANKDIWKIMEYCRSREIIPNITINGYRMTDDIYNNLIKYCGVISVSLYENKHICYDTVKELIKRGMKQTNIHCLVAYETFDRCMMVMKDYQKDKRLKGLNAIVFLKLKPKGKNNNLTPMPFKMYKEIIKYAINNDIPIGADSCSASDMMSCVKGTGYYNKWKNQVESCESLLFSGYVNVNGNFFPCSFAEGEKGWGKGLDIINCKDFLKDIWFHKKSVEFRENSIKSIDNNSCRNCILFDI